MGGHNFPEILLLIIATIVRNGHPHKIIAELAKMEKFTELNFVVLGRNTCFDIQTLPFFHPERFNVSSRPPGPQCFKVYTGCYGCVGDYEEVRGRMISSPELKDRLLKVQVESADYSVYLQSCPGDEGDKLPRLTEDDENPWVFRIFDVNTKLQDINDHIAQHFIGDGGGVGFIGRIPLVPLLAGVTLLPNLFRILILNY